MSKSKVSNELTTVTPLSKFLAGALFVFLPIIAFLMGMNYQRQLDSELKYRMMRAEMSNGLVAQPQITPTVVQVPADWKEFKNPTFNLDFKHPANLVPRQTVANKMLTVTMQNEMNDFKLTVKPATADAEMVDMDWEMGQDGNIPMYKMQKNKMLYDLTVTKSETQEIVDQMLESFRQGMQPTQQ